MKIHITNLYNFDKHDKLVEKQHIVANNVRGLGILEMGIFSYPVETDTEQELSKRIDGVISSLEHDDVVILQLPTRNGYLYEQLLIDKIKAYTNTKLIMFLHESVTSDLSEQDVNIYKCADVIVVPNEGSAKVLKKSEIDKVLYYNQIKLLHNSFHVQKVLMEAIDKVYSEEINVAYSAQQPDQDEIQIGFGIHDKTGTYCSWLGTTIQSITEHTTAKICFHVLHDDTLTNDNRRKLFQIIRNSGNRIVFHLIDESVFNELESQMGAYTIGAMFRVLLPEVLNKLDKIIYLDADLLVNRDIKELWDIDIHNYYMAAVPDMEVINGAIKPVAVKRGEVQAERYFNSGVIYMNLELIREKGSMKTQIMEYLDKTKESDLPDQDALNAIYTNKTLLLDGSWNYFTKVARKIGEKHLEKRIYHYVGTPCLLYYGTDFDRLYLETMYRTPWGQTEGGYIIQRNFQRVMDRYTQLDQILRLLSESRRKCIYYGDETNGVRSLYDLLSIREGDYRISALPEKQYDGILPCKDISALFEEKDEYVLFVLPEADNGRVFEYLDQHGMKNGKDYYVIPRLLLPHNGGYV